jgi:hypothetical protein
MDKKAEDIPKFSLYLPGLCAYGVIPQNSLVTGIANYLNYFDDMIVDLPRLGEYVSVILAYLAVPFDQAKGNYRSSEITFPSNASVHSGAFIDNLAFILTLPDENNFSLSMRAHELIVQVHIYTTTTTIYASTYCYM